MSYQSVGVKMAARSLRVNIVPIIAIFVTLTIFLLFWDRSSSGFDELNAELQSRIDENQISQEELDALLQSHQDEFEGLDVKIFGELDPNEVQLNSDMFFFVPSGATDLTHRQACTVEAAAQFHHGRNIFVLFITANITNVIDSGPMSSLLAYDNVVFRFIKASKYLTGNKYMESWFVNSGFQEGANMGEHLGNGLTFAMLYKFGGTVLSFDTLLLRSISWMGDILPRCHEDIIESYPLALRSKHPLALDAMEQMVEHHDSTDPKATGSHLLTQRLKKLCSVEFIKELLFKECGAKSDAKVLTSDVLCRIEEDKHWQLFDPIRAKLVLQKVEEQKVSGLKLWSDYTGDYPSWGSSEKPTAFYQLARKACPLISHSIGEKNHF